MIPNQDIVERLKSMECPAGKVEKKVLELLVAYKVADSSHIAVSRDETLDSKGGEAYRAEIYGSNPMSFALLCKNGVDDYVAKVVDVIETSPKTEENIR